VDNETVVSDSARPVTLAELVDGAACLSAYYTSLLTWVGCAVDTAEVAALFGDETEFYAATRDGDYGGAGLAIFVARHLGRGKPGFHRIGMVGTFLASAGRSVQQVMAAHCQEASDLAGARHPPGPPGRQRRGVPPRRRRHGRAAGGPRATRHAVRSGGIPAWEEVIGLDPRLGTALSDDQLDRALSAFADFSDLKSPLRLGRSREVADLAAQAGKALGLPAADIVMLRRAALVQDIGMTGVPSGVWEEPGQWSIAQRERARTHPYLTEREEVRAGRHVSRKTVSSHLEHIYAKLGVKTRTEAALFAMRHGLIGMADEPGS
jgi:hypothetical protein